jgi:hypothetical protein
MKPNSERAGAKHNRAASPQQQTSKREAAAAPQTTPAPANGAEPLTTPPCVQRAGIIRHRSSAAESGFLHDTTQAALGGVAGYQAFRHDETVAIFCLAISSMAESIRDRLLPELDARRAEHGTHLREHLQWGEAIRIANAVLRRRALGALAGDDPAQTFNLPLPGIAGFMAFSYECLAIEFAALLYVAREELVEKVVKHLADEDAITLIGEALVLAEHVFTESGNLSDLDEDSLSLPGLGDPTPVMRDAWAWKSEAHFRRRPQ